MRERQTERERAKGMYIVHIRTSMAPSLSIDSLSTFLWSSCWFMHIVISRSVFISSRNLTTRGWQQKKTPMCCSFLHTFSVQDVRMYVQLCDSGALSSSTNIWLFLRYFRIKNSKEDKEEEENGGDKKSKSVFIRSKQHSIYLVD